MLKVRGRRSSFDVQKVMWLIGELGLEHQHIDVGGRLHSITSRPRFFVPSQVSIAENKRARSISQG